MNPIFSRILKALCSVMAAAMLSACGGASSTVDPFVATRVIAFGDGFNYVDGAGAGLSTVQTGETDNTIAGRIAARYGIVVKAVASNALASTGGFSYAVPTAKVSDVATQISTFLSATGNVISKNDLIIIAAGNWDIKGAASSNDTAAIDTATTALVTAIQSLTNAGAEHVVVIPSINMARTPWAAGSAGISASTIQNLSNSVSTSFNFTLNTKLGNAYRQDHKDRLRLCHAVRRRQDRPRDQDLERGPGAEGTRLGLNRPSQETIRSPVRWSGRSSCALRSPWWPESR